MTARRVISVRIEAEVEVADARDFAALKERLVTRCRYEVDSDPRVTAIYEAAVVTRRPGMHDGDLS